MWYKYLYATHSRHAKAHHLEMKTSLTCHLKSHSSLTKFKISSYHDLLMHLPQRRINSTEFPTLIHVSERNLNDKQICISKILMCWSHMPPLQNILESYFINHIQSKEDYFSQHKLILDCTKREGAIGWHSLYYIGWICMILQSKRIISPFGCPWSISTKYLFFLKLPILKNYELCCWTVAYFGKINVHLPQALNDKGKKKQNFM